MMNVSEIKDRTSYLKFRQEWRTLYKDLSQRIRTAKADRNTLFKKGYKNAGRVQSMLASMRGDARRMMDLLEQAKETRPSRNPVKQIAA